MTRGEKIALAGFTLAVVGGGIYLLSRSSVNTGVAGTIRQNLGSSTPSDENATVTKLGNSLASLVNALGKSASKATGSLGGGSSGGKSGGGDNSGAGSVNNPAASHSPVSSYASGITPSTSPVNSAQSGSVALSVNSEGSSVDSTSGDDEG